MRKSKELEITNIPWLIQNIDHAWDHSADYPIERYIKGAWAGSTSRRPDHFVSMFYEARLIVAETLQFGKIDVAGCCGAIAHDLLVNSSDVLSVQRSVAAAVVFGAEPADREAMLDFLQHRDGERTLYFGAAAMLAERRARRPGFTREELMAWKIRLLPWSILPERQKLLNYIERALGND